MNKDSETEESPIRSVLRSSMAWLFLVFCLGFLIREAYLRYTGERSSLEPLYWYLFVEHRAISMPIVVLVLITALLVEHIRANRNPGTRLGLLSKIVALCAIALAGYISINGI
ncbi:hypothetical protein ACEN8I_19950 [Polaromonas sp. CT11-55]|uniref:hypothetical protein n=1 Tax=Polaromonas sp. CT11-55 TaxID=3243045 RepID=UPI0039A70AC5